MAEPEKIRVVAAEIEQDGQFLLTQRREAAIFPLLWEFPSGRVEDGEEDAVALVRELRERLDVEIRVDQVSMFIKHTYDEYELDFCVYRCQLVTDDIKAIRVKDWKWVSPQEMDDYEFPPADAKTLKRLLENR